MGEETRTCPVVSPKAAGDRQNAPCQKGPKRPRRESSGCTPRALKTPRAAWQALEKEQFLKRAAALGRKGESTVGIVGGVTSIQGSPLSREAVGSNKGLLSVHFLQRNVIAEQRPFATWMRLQLFCFVLARNIGVFRRRKKEVHTREQLTTSATRRARGFDKIRNGDPYFAK